jgi:hypothetical protein
MHEYGHFPFTVAPLPDIFSLDILFSLTQLLLKLCHFVLHFWEYEKKNVSGILSLGNHLRLWDNLH